MELVFGILLLVMALFLVVAVALQSGKEKGLGGSVAGGADTFFGNGKNSTRDQKLNLITTIVSAIFVVVVVVMYIVVS